MTLTVEKVETFVRRRLDGGSSVDVFALCNMAGRHVVAMHTWEWLVRPPVTLTLPSGRQEIPLPKDFGRVIKIDTGGTLLNGFVLTTPSHLLDLETNIINLTNVGYWGAVIWKKCPPSDGLAPYLRLYPGVGATESLKMYYYSGWVDLSDENDTIDIPNWLEPLFLEVVFAFAQGYDEPEMGDLNERLAKVMVSPVFNVAVMQDASVQDELGELRNGVDSYEGIYQSANIVGGPYPA